MKLKLQSQVTIIPTTPFDFDSTFYKPDHFTSGDNFWEPGVRWQTWGWEGALFGLKFENTGTVEKPRILVNVYAKPKPDKNLLDSLIQEIEYRYNLKLDLTGFYSQLAGDKNLDLVIRRLRGMRPGHPSSLYEYLIIGIVLQNATVRRSIQMFEALLTNYGTLLEFDSKQLWCFWSPGTLEKVTVENLRLLKVGYRAKSIKKIDDYFARSLINELDLRRESRETQMKKLLELYGVGPATVWYLLFDVFHQWDFFNHISPWEQKIYSKLFFDTDPENPVPTDKLLKYFDKFGKYKQLAVHYIWEDLWWKRKNEKILWLEKLIRV
jgi:3-methyladenine DNA glycosylase/8-oxoguanine DNA glycosylase